jgi:hypothetical protein
MLKKMAWAFVLALTTSATIALLATELRNSRAGDYLIEGLALPGAWIASLMYPQGVHTGRGAPLWGAAVIVCNFVVYALFWFACLNVWSRFVAHKGQHEAH